jgi:hypothetical protein
MLMMRADALIYPADLVNIDKRIYTVPESDLIQRTVFAPKTDDPEWCEVIGYDTQTRTGAARLMNTIATDFPLVDVDIERKTQKVHELVSGFSLRRAELLAARGLGKDIDATKADAARRVMSVEEGNIVWNGNAEFNIQGLLTWTNRLETAATKAFTATTTHWHAASEDEGNVIVAHIRQAVHAQTVLNGVSPKALLLAKANVEYLGYFMSAERNMTVREYLAQAGWFPQGIFSSTEFPEDRFAVIDTLPEHIQLSIPQDLLRLDPFPVSPFTTIIPVDERLAGLVVRMPQCISIITGIAA